jgi:predicted phage terminase large subunit-like protein
MTTTQEINQAAAVLAKKHLLPFTIVAFPEFKLGKHIKLLASKLEAVERGEIKRLIITMPPRHCKSLLCSQYFPAWYLGKNPTRQIITASYGDELARDFGRKVRNTIAENEFKQIFDTSLSDDSSSQNKFNTKEGGVYVATGIGGAITGRGADLAIIDDAIKGRQDADSEQIRKKVWEWYTSVLRTRMMPNGAIIVVGTRWHKDDLIGRLLKENTEGWEILHLPAINENNEPLWPEMFSLEELEKTKRAIGAREWLCLYQGTPSDPENQIFHPEMFRYYEELPTEGEMTICMTVDPAFTQNKTSDDSCIMLTGKWKDKTYVLEYFNGKVLPNGLINEIIRLYKKWKPHYVGIEAFSAQKVIGFYLQEKIAQEGINFTWQEIKQTGDKLTKVKRLEPYLREGKILMKRHHTALETQLIEFPQGDHDDIVDALQMSFEFRIFEVPQKPNDDYFGGLGITYNSYAEPIYD